jgi:hypothetical protein
MGLVYSDSHFFEYKFFKKILSKNNLKKFKFLKKYIVISFYFRRFFKKSSFGFQILELVSLIQNGSLICPPTY